MCVSLCPVSWVFLSVEINQEIVFTPILISSNLFCSTFSNFGNDKIVFTGGALYFILFQKQLILCGLSSLPIECNHGQFRCRPKMSGGTCCSGAFRRGRFSNPARLRGNEDNQQLWATNRPVLGEYIREISSTSEADNNLNSE